MKRSKEQNRKIGVASRRKGVVGEKEAARLWRTWFPHCKRMFPCQQQGVKMPDIGCPDMNKTFYVEVKRRKKISDADAYRYWEKVQRDRWDYNQEFDAYSKPFMMFREDRKEWQVATCIGSWSRHEIELLVDDRPGYRYEDLIIIPWSAFADFLQNTDVGVFLRTGEEEDSNFTVTEVSGE